MGNTPLRQSDAVVSVLPLHTVPFQLINIPQQGTQRSFATAKLQADGLADNIQIATFKTGISTQRPSSPQICFILIVFEGTGQINI